MHGWESTPAKGAVPNCFLCDSPGRRPGLQRNADDAIEFAAGVSTSSLNGHSLDQGYDVPRESGGVGLWRQIAVHPGLVQALAKRRLSGHTTGDQFLARG